MEKEQRRKISKKRATENNGSSPPASNPPKSPECDDKPLFELQGVKSPSERESFLHTQKVSVTVKAEFVPDLKRGARSAESASVARDDLIEIEFAGGERLWLRGDDYYARFGGPGTRDVSREGVLSAPDSLDLLPAGMQARGPVSWAVKSLKVLGVDLAGKTAAKLAESIERRASNDPEEKKKRPGLGLYRCSTATGNFSLAAAEPGSDSGESPYLVFVHGTGSTTWGSFGDLWSPERKAELEMLRKAYGDRILAFEHASLTKSPLENALDLARKLPANARLHLVTHSRGGLVGELLCRASIAQEVKKTEGTTDDTLKAPMPFQPEEFLIFERDEKYRKQLSLLKQLDEEFKSRQFRVERFVRVACPALGTTLASGRLDRWLSMIGSIAGAAMPGTPLCDMFQDIGDFTAAVIKERTDPSTLPGLEAMMPDSSFIKLVNWPKAAVPGDLAVIAGDIDPDAWWARMMVWVSDRFYDGDHDLVVNTASMLGGARRQGQARVSFHKGSEVNHFRYFKNQPSAQRIVQALTAEGTDWQGFEPLCKPSIDIARALVSRSPAPMPVVFVLPGIMGSELSVGRDHVWFDVIDLMFGGLAQLCIDACDVVPTQPFARYYGELCCHLSATHKVVPFPFDWRISVEKEADRLAEALQRELDLAKPHNKPVRILAHSMGGLVARTMIARHEKLWRDICSVDGARLVMLGTPNGGSHAITELLVGQASTLRQLACLDLKHSKSELLEIISRFPGVLAMLPKDDREDYFSPQVWQRYYSQSDPKWVLPAAGDLAAALRCRQCLDSSPIDPRHMIYVAGSADVTLADMILDMSEECPEKRIKFLATTRGDGRVTWDSGLLPGVPTWYMDVEHGELPAYEEGFPAITELLDTGKTTLLPQQAPVSRAVATLFPKPPPAEELFPNEEVMACSMLGGGPRKRRRTVLEAPPVKLKVLHGNIAFATHPVAVGHYAGDSIVSAERQLDMHLGGALSRRHGLGIYPSAIETSAFFINPRLASDPRATPKGAIVVGLGTVGSLSASKLTRSFTRALLEYVTEWAEHQRQSEDVQPGSLGVSVPMIGAGEGGISVSDSILALLRGVSRANSALSNIKSPYRISSLEFVELQEARAIQAVRVLKRLLAKYTTSKELVFDGTLHSMSGGFRGLAYEEADSWWQRLQILGGGKEGEPGDGTLRFSASTRRARGEVRLLPTQRALVDQFIAGAIRTTSDNRSIAKTLFELLLPNELKEQAPDQDNLVIILDEEAARYPWELIEDPMDLEGKPLAVEIGLLRQLESTTFRERVRGVTDNTALVIGDPISKFPELKGAQEEAVKVVRALQSDGRFNVEHALIRPTSERVVSALFDGAYRVLHLAGHGAYRYRPDEEKQCKLCHQQLPTGDGEMGELLTGMIIGDRMVLSPREVKQMRMVPELVFINCCHLGLIEPPAGADAQGPNLSNDYNLFAANVATELIRMGVRAVVAAGWAVDDAAAATFALGFYEEMLSGRPFGEAVHEARKTTYERHPQTNTWGAYQCYGDPAYRLVPVSEKSGSGTEDSDFVSPLEAIVRLDNLTSRLTTMASESIKSEIDSLERIEQAVKAGSWLRDGRICAAFGRAFGQANCFERAIRYYREALRSADSGMTLRDIEQLANLESRHAVQRWKKGESAEAVLADIDTAISRLECLTEGLETGQHTCEATNRLGACNTAERLSLLGSAYKRRAWVSRAGRPESLDRMVRYYREALSVAEKEKKLDCYSLLNWLAGELALDWQDGTKQSSALQRVPGFADLLGRARSELAAEWATSRSFWTAVMQVDLSVIEALAEGKLEGGADTLARGYLEAGKLASPREFESALDQIAFLAEIAEEDLPLAKALATLHRKCQRK